MELMITVSVLAILAALALPSFQSVLDNRRLAGAAENLFADLQYARSESIKQNEEIRLQVTSGINWCFGVDDEVGVSCDCNSNACEVGDILKNTTASAYSNIQMSAGNVVEFEPRQGFPSPSATYTYTFRIGASGKVKTVTVNPIGRIKMD
ncbi:hypothetical protein A9Q78_01905 [Methylophaga sp. 41_12_T18]|nr:hypothetical protein A9Q78_01905 [Methylophaga sp. 41_12_T18]